MRKLAIFLVAISRFGASFGAPILAVFLLLTGMVGCKKWEVPDFADSPMAPNSTIADLRAYYADNEVIIGRDVVVEGRVVSSDEAGNFYNTFFIDDGTGGIEIMAGMRWLSATYHPGQRVVVRARGLATGWRDGAMQLGRPPEPGNRFPTGYFLTPAEIEKYVTAELDFASVAPLETTLDALQRAFCGRLVRIGGLVADPLLPENSTWATAFPEPRTGYIKFFEKQVPDLENDTENRSKNAGPGAENRLEHYGSGAGNRLEIRAENVAVKSENSPEITVVTSGYASFAQAPVPREKTVTLTGILLYNGGWILKLRDTQDVEY